MIQYYRCFVFLGVSYIFFLGFLILQNLCLHGSIAVLPTVYKRVIKFVKKGEESRLVCPCRMMPAKCAACGRLADREAKVASGRAGNFAACHAISRNRWRAWTDASGDT